MKLLVQPDRSIVIVIVIDGGGGGLEGGGPPLPHYIHPCSPIPNPQSPFGMARATMRVQLYYVFFLHASLLFALVCVGQ